MSKNKNSRLRDLKFLYKNNSVNKDKFIRCILFEQMVPWKGLRSLSNKLRNYLSEDSELGSHFLYSPSCDLSLEKSEGLILYIF